ncbi:MAG TPA: hypothetical protein VN704_09120 [Verrucomicrobiae bacterium]|nr:hypothetical protein [Verrucomicrobiae bacterium]
MNKEYIYIGLIVLFIFLIFGYSIDKLIDQKLSDIHINLPKINIPEPNIIIKMKKKKKNVKPINSTDNNCAIPNVVNENTVENFDPNIKENPFTAARSNRNRNQGIPYISETEIEENPSEFSKKKLPYLGTIIGCQKQGKYKLQPDQIACNQPNYRTAEHYYDYYFKYPVIPQMDQDKWLPASIVTRPSYGNTDDYMSPDRNYRVVPQHYATTIAKPPLPSNYEFSYIKR